MLFMLAPRWPDDVRTRDRTLYRHSQWHYVNWPFKPEGQLATVQSTPPAFTNIQNGLAANEKSARTEPDPQQLIILRAIGLPSSRVKITLTVLATTTPVPMSAAISSKIDRALEVSGATCCTSPSVVVCLSFVMAFDNVRNLRRLRR